MGIYIKDIEMPTTESEVLIIAIESDGSVYPVRIDGDGQPMIFPNEEMKNCAVSVSPHGRLGDLDELYASLEKWLIQNRHSMTEATRVWIRGVLEGIAAAPTIIPAEEGER